MTCARLVLFSFPTRRSSDLVMMLVQPTVLVTVVTLTFTLAWQASTNVGALKLGAVGHSIVASAPGLKGTPLAARSSSVMTSAWLVLLTQPSLAVQVRVMMLV